MSSNVFNLISQEVFSEKMDTLTQAIQKLNSGGSSEPVDPDQPVNPDPEVIYNNNGLEYKARAITIDSSHTWDFTYTCNKIHFMLSIQDRCVATSVDGDVWKTAPIILDFDFAEYASLELMQTSDRIIMLEHGSTAVYTSTDGYSWSKISDALPIAFCEYQNGLTYFNNKFIAASNQEIISTAKGYACYTMISEDGINWSHKLVYLKWSPNLSDEYIEVPSGKTMCIVCANNQIFITLSGIGLFSISEDLSTASYLSPKQLLIENYFDNKYLAFEFTTKTSYGYTDNYYELYSTIDLINWTSENINFSYSLPRILINSKAAIITGAVGESSTCFLYTLKSAKWKTLSTIDTDYNTIHVVNDAFIQASNSNYYESDTPTLSISSDGLTWLSGYNDYLEQDEVNVTEDVKNLILKDQFYFTQQEIDIAMKPPTPYYCYADVMNAAGIKVQRIVALNSSYNSLEIMYSDDDGATWLYADIDNITDFLMYGINDNSGELDISVWTNICHTGSEFVALQNKLNLYGGYPSIQPCLASSADGSKWDIISPLPDEFDSYGWISICPVNNGLIALKADGACLITYNNGRDTLAGVTFSSIELQNINNLKKIISISYGNYAFAIGGRFGIFFDSDGQVFKHTELPADNFIDAVWDGYTVYAVSSDGLIAYIEASHDGGYFYIDSNWTSLGSPIRAASSITLLRHQQVDENNELYISTDPCIVYHDGFYLFNRWYNYLTSTLPRCLSDDYVSDDDLNGIAYIYQAKNDVIYHYFFNLSQYSYNHSHIYASTDYGKSWCTKIANLMQSDNKVTEDVSSALWPSLERNVSSKIATSTSTHLIIDKFQSLDEAAVTSFYNDYSSSFIYNKLLDRFAISKDSSTIWYSDDKMTTWKVYNSYNNATVVASVDHAFILEERVCSGNDQIIEQSFYAHTLENTVYPVACRFYDEYNSRCSLPVSNYKFTLGQYNGVDRLIMYSDDILAYSDNGVQWYVLNSVFNLATTPSIIYHNNTWVAIHITNTLNTLKESAGIYIHYSTDGIHWASCSSDPLIRSDIYEYYPYKCQLTAGADTIFLQVSYAFYPAWQEGGPAYTAYVFKSNDGQVWEEFTARTTSNEDLGVKLPYDFVNGRFIDLTNQLCSYDGVEWFTDESLPRPITPENFSNTGYIVYANETFALAQCSTQCSTSRTAKHRTVFYKTLDSYSWTQCAPPSIVTEASNTTNILSGLATAIYSSIINTQTITILPTDWIDEKCVYARLPVDNQSIIFVSANSKTASQYIASQIQCVEQGPGYITLNYSGNIPTEKILIDILIIQPTPSTGIGPTIRLYDPSDYE